MKEKTIKEIQRRIDYLSMQYQNFKPQTQKEQDKIEAYFNLINHGKMR